jgi:hypothetical protein
MGDFHELLGAIAHCAIANAIRSGVSPDSAPCHKVVNLQPGSSFQLPEPWSGQLAQVASTWADGGKLLSTLSVASSR